MSGRDAVDLLLGLAALFAALPAGVFLIEMVAAAWNRRPTPTLDGVVRSGSLAVLMPAHDEAAGIAAAIGAALAQLGHGDRLLVVADNCSDDTAAVAAAAGAEIVERRDLARRGKGYALDHGVRHLEAAPPAVVVVLDADCIVAPEALPRLAAACMRSGRPVQALYRMDAPAGASLSLRIAAFAWRVKNKLRPLGAAALGAPVQLMGTGMAFPWPLLRDARLASGHLVEDLQLGIDLARAGASPLFLVAAEVSSTFPSDAAALRTQRTRWEHGHLSTLGSAGPRLLLHGLRRGEPALAAMALDLMVPPLAALVLVLAMLVVAGGGWWAVDGRSWAFAVALLGLAMVAVGTAIAWRREGRDLVGAREWLHLPLYVAAKLPMYLRWFGRRQVEWVRTRRDGPGR